MRGQNDSVSDKKRYSFMNVAVVSIIILSAFVIMLTAGFLAFRYTNSDQELAVVSGNASIVQPAPTLAEVNQDSLDSPQEPISSRPASTAVPAVLATRNPIRPKPIVAGNTNRQSLWTPTPLPTATPSPTHTPYPTFVSLLNEYTLLRPPGLSPNERWVDVDLTNQKLVAYEGHLPVFESLVSSGLARYPTVTGQFKIWLRFKAQTMNGRRLGYDYYLENVPYVQYFYQDYALHGTYWHNNFGHPMSHGCVNLPTPAAEWLFNWAEHGTIVNIHY
jgi:lipoprotein-anchoring transpeptidase ErfK/SrfK